MLDCLVNRLFSIAKGKYHRKVTWHHSNATTLFLGQEASHTEQGSMLEGSTAQHSMFAMQLWLACTTLIRVNSEFHKRESLSIRFYVMEVCCSFPMLDTGYLDVLFVWLQEPE